MAEFFPRQGPEYQDESLRRLVKWAESEFQRIARANQEASLVPMEELHVAVDKPREGMLVRADGTNWNPGQGKGTYERVNGVWRRVAGLTDGDYGDVTVSSNGTVISIDNNAVTLAKLADIATARFIGRVTAGTGDPEAITGTQATTLLDLFTSALKGLVPASGGGTTNFLRADGNFAAPPSPTVVTAFEEGSLSGANVVVDNITANDAMLVQVINASHDSGAAQSLRVELSANNGSSYGTAITLTGSGVAATPIHVGFFVTPNAAKNTHYVTPTTGNFGDVQVINAVNAIRLSFSGGNFDAGNYLVTLFGS